MRLRSRPSPAVSNVSLRHLDLVAAAREAVSAPLGIDLEATSSRFGPLAPRDDDPGLPARRPSPARKRDRLDVESAAGDEPGDGRVRVPHLAGVQLVAAPDGRRYLRHELEQAPGALRIVAEALGALDRFVEIGDQPLAPAADLVAEEREACQRLWADRTFGDDATILALSPHGCLLDHEPRLGDVDLQRRVVEGAGRAPVEACREPLEDASVPANGVAAGAERQPVQVDAGGGRRGRRSHQRAAFLPWRRPSCPV